MLLLLPPSETKREGGDGAPLDLRALSFPALTASRRAAIGELSRLSRSVQRSAAALGLGPTQRGEIDRNRALRTAPTMPAIERYTGVVYEPLAGLTPAELAFATTHVAIGSALFGLLGAADPIPAYRLSHDSRLPDLPLRRHWRDAVSAELARHDGLVLDLRSEAYAALGPAPGGRYLRVLAEDARGRRRALSHFNKHAKGVFTRAVIAAGVVHADEASLLAWATAQGIRLEPGRPGELDLITTP